MYFHVILQAQLFKGLFRLVCVRVGYLRGEVSGLWNTRAKGEGKEKNTGDTMASSGSGGLSVAGGGSDALGGSRDPRWLLPKHSGSFYSSDAVSLAAAAAGAVAIAGSCFLSRILDQLYTHRLQAYMLSLAWRRPGVWAPYSLSLS